MEEIYFVLSGEGEMSVDEETRHVRPGDATWIPAGSAHSLTNSGEGDLLILVVASSNW
jgi:mannose-6-phosphate isomerase-like protein (cupin superfamily)